MVIFGAGGVLGIALVFESVSWIVAYRAIRSEYPDVSPFVAARRSKDPGLFVVLFEDTAAIVGLVVALVIGTFAATLFPSRHLDAVASLLIGILLIATALFLMNRTRSLLVGESADEEIVDGIRALLAVDPRVESVHRILTAQMSPGHVLLNIDVRLNRGLVGMDVIETIQDVELGIRREFPSVKEVFIEVQALM